MEQEGPFRHDDEALEAAIEAVLAARQNALQAGLDWHQVLSEASMREGRELGGDAWLVGIVKTATGNLLTDANWVRGYHAGTDIGTRLARVTDHDLQDGLAEASGGLSETIADLQELVAEGGLARAERARRT